MADLRLHGHTVRLSENMSTETRDSYLCEDYASGTEIGELSRMYGICERRVGQILRLNNIPVRPRPVKEKKPLSSQHTRLGLHLYHYRHERGVEPREAADNLGWFVLKLRKVEMGTTSVELLDLYDIAANTETRIEELVKQYYG